MTPLSSVGAAGTAAFSPTAISGSRPSAEKLIGEFTNPSTNTLDTRGLAERMAELSEGSPEAADALLSEVESALKRSETSQFTLADLRTDFAEALAMADGTEGQTEHGLGTTVEKSDSTTSSSTPANKHASEMAEKQQTLEQLFDKHPELEERLQNDPHFQLLQLEAENANRKLHLGAAAVIGASYAEASTKINQALLAVGGGAAGKAAVAVTGNKLLGEAVDTLLEEAGASPATVAELGTDLIREGMQDREAAGERLLQYAQTQADRPSPAEVDEMRAAKAAFTRDVLDLQSITIEPGELLIFAEYTTKAAASVERVIQEDYSDFTFNATDQHFRNGTLESERYYAEASTGIAVWEREGGDWKQLANEAGRHRDAVEKYIKETPTLVAAIANAKIALAEAAAASKSEGISPELVERVSQTNDTLGELMAPIQEDLQQLQKIKALYDAYRSPVRRYDVSHFSQQGWLYD